MLLKNYYTLLDAVHTDTSKPYVDTSGAQKTTSGASYAKEALRIANSMKTIGTSATAYNTYCVIFGDGDTPPTLNDYRLSGTIIRLSGNGTVTVNSDENGIVYKSVFSLTNQNSESVTIREVLLMGATQQFAAALDRTVLDTPLTIPAGGYGQLEYTIRMNFPTA